MKFAVVINVEPGSDALKQALLTQTLLLDRIGVRLESIRLAAPRLLHHACASAIAERPDALVIAGGPRSARRAGQLAYEGGIPIAFLPGFRSPGWAKQLWGALSLEALIDSLARNELTTTRIDVGAANGQIFFDSADCGLLPHIGELRHAIDEADTFSEGWYALMRGAGLARNLLHPNVHFDTAESDNCRATALTISTKARTAGSEMPNQRPAATLGCTAFRHGPIGYLGALVRSGLGADWRGKTHAKHSECTNVTLNARDGTWLLLDGDPVRFDGPVQFHLLPAAIQSFLFTPTHKIANDNPALRRPRSRSFNTAAEIPWNFTPPSLVANRESRGSGDETQKAGVIMLSWALTFLVIAIIAAIFGFGGIAATASSIAQILFVVFLALFVVSLIVAMARGRPPAV